MTRSQAAEEPRDAGAEWSAFQPLAVGFRIADTQPYTDLMARAPPVARDCPADLVMVSRDR